MQKAASARSRRESRPLTPEEQEELYAEHGARYEKEQLLESRSDEKCERASRWVGRVQAPLEDKSDSEQGLDENRQPDQRNEDQGEDQDSTVGAREQPK